MNVPELTPASATAKLIEKFELSPNCDTPQQSTIFAEAHPSKDEPEEEESTEEWAIGSDYDLEERLGTGSYGDVAKAKHLPTGETVAIKRVYNVFQHERDARYV